MFEPPREQMLRRNQVLTITVVVAVVIATVLAARSLSIEPATVRVVTSHVTDAEIKMFAADGLVIDLATVRADRRLRDRLARRGRYDNAQAFAIGAPTPGFYDDDARGLKWATTVQKDVPWGSDYFNEAWKAMYHVESALQLDAFRLAMAVTGEPQFVLLWTPTGRPSHAMVADGVDGDRLVIADPNGPDINPNWITFDPATSRFVPFVSGATADGPTITFAEIGYAAKSPLFDWDSIARRFAETEGGRSEWTGFPRMSSSRWSSTPTGWRSTTP